jgi:transposase
MGMVSVGTIAIDGTKLKANASYRRTKRGKDLDRELEVIEREIESILKESEAVDNREDEQMGEDESPYEVPLELRGREELRERLRRAKERLLVQGSKEINLTDAEATTMLHGGYRAEPSYNGQVAVEESHGVIVAATLSSNPADYEAMTELVGQTEENTGDKPLEVLGDSGFSSYENLQYLEEKGIEGYIPDQGMESLRKGSRRHDEFHRSRFRYDQGEDQYICPMGRFLPYQGLLKRQGKPAIRIYRCPDCPECGRKSECTRAAYRTISLDPREHLMRKMRTRLETPEGRKKYSKRKYVVEPVFGDMKFNRKMAGLLLRGKLKARGEFLIMCIAHNLRKIGKYLSYIPPEPNLQPLMA